MLFSTQLVKGLSTRKSERNLIFELNKQKKKIKCKDTMKMTTKYRQAEIKNYLDLV